MLNRITRGYSMSKASFALLRSEPKLLVLPVISTATIGFVAAIYVGGLYTAGVRFGDGYTAWLELLPLYFIMTLIGVIANATLVVAASAKFDGRAVSISAAFAAVKTHMARIVAWSLVSSTIGVAIRALEERVPFAGRILLAIAGTAWNLATVLIVPVLLFEDLPVRDSLKRSAGLFKNSWGEELSGSAAIGIGVIIVTILLLGVEAVITAFFPWVGLALIALTLIGAFVVSAALNAIFNTALYRYATGNEALGPFPRSVLSSVYGR